MKSYKNKWVCNKCGCSLTDNICLHCNEVNYERKNKGECNECGCSLIDNICLHCE